MPVISARRLVKDGAACVTPVELKWALAPCVWPASRFRSSWTDIVVVFLALELGCGAIRRRCAVLYVPANRFSQATGKIHLCPNAERPLGARCVQAPARLPIGLRMIPADSALKAALGGDDLRQIAN